MTTPQFPRDGAGPWRRTALTIALGCMFVAPHAWAADDAAVQEQLRRLAERLQQLEQRNQQLERQVKDLSARPAASATAPAAAPMVPVEPEAGPESDAPKFTAALSGVAQNVNGGGSADGRSQTRLNYRGDVTAELAAGSLGDAEGKVFAQLRFGAGNGVGLRPTHTGAVNSVAFETASGPDDSYAIVAQAWYQLNWQLDAGGFDEKLGSRVEMTVGKMDVFGFFDQNTVAGDESAQFLNNVFVHNPMLDSGGDTAADSYGFAPGLRLGYFDATGGKVGWGASVGVLASGGGASFAASPGRPLVIAQFEASPLQVGGDPKGTYRVYVWSNGHTSDISGAEQRHRGIGVSADQHLGAEWNLFGRWGRRFSGDGAFDHALTLGFEHGGRAWGRGSDAIGVAMGWLGTDKVWRDATANGALAGYAASGNERIAEAYYRMKLNDKLSVSPDLQLIQRAGGDAQAPLAKVVGVRATLGF